MNIYSPKIGILGLGSRSTLFYIENLNNIYNKRFGSYHSFPCLIYNVDFNTINPHLPDKFDKLIPTLKNHLTNIFNLKINYCLIPNITLHETYDLANLSYNICHPIKLTVDYLTAHKINKVVLFGSKYTMTSNYIKSNLKKNHIAVILPDEQDMANIDILRQKLYNYTESKTDIENYKLLIKKYSGNTPILISCTELSILNDDIENLGTIIDCAFLQIEHAINLSV